MKALVVTSSFPRNERDTAGAFLLPLVRALRATGMDVEVLAPRGEGARRWEAGLFHAPYAPRSEENLFYGAGAPHALARLGKRAWPWVASSVASLAAHIRWRQPDVVYAHWLVPAGLAARLSGLPYVAYAHGTDVTLLGDHAPWLARTVARGASAVCVPSPSLAQRLWHACGVDARVLPLPVEKQAASPLGAWDVGFLGRLVPGKGVDVLLDSCARAGVSVVVGGDGPERSSLERQATALGVRATFLGWVSPDERGSFWNSVRVACVPSVAPEGSPSVLWEACAHEVPVLVSRIPGLADAVEDAFCVPPGDAKALATMLRVALLDENWRSLALKGGAVHAAARSPAVLGPQHAGLLAQACVR